MKRLDRTRRLSSLSTEQLAALAVALDSVLLLNAHFDNWSAGPVPEVDDEGEDDGREAEDSDLLSRWMHRVNGA